MENRMVENGSVRTVTDQTFSDDVIQAEGLNIVDFWAVWCGPCRMVAPIVEQLASEYGEKGLRVSKLDVDENPVTASRYGIRSIPTILFFKGGELVDRVIGAVPRPHLEQKVKQHLGV
jgi:thioredoxin 1